MNLLVMVNGDKYISKYYLKIKSLILSILLRMIFYVYISFTRSKYSI